MEIRIIFRSRRGNKSNHLNEYLINKKATTTVGTTGNSAIRLKGQMK